MSQVDGMAAKERLKKALDSINEVLREVQRLQPSVPPLSPRVRNQLQSTTRKLKIAVSEIETVMREPDGHVVITLARDARAGNWLPIGGGSRVTLVMTVQDAAWAAASMVNGAPKPLPEIQRVACR